HGLLALDGGIASGQLGASGLQLLRLLLARFGLLDESCMPLIELCRLLFEFARVALQRLEAAVDFKGLFLQLPLALLEGSSQSIEADEVGLMLGLALAQCFTLVRQALLAGSSFGLPAGGLGLSFALALLQLLLFFLQG